MNNVIDSMESEGWARLECAGWGMPPSLIHRAWYAASGHVLMSVSDVAWRATDGLRRLRSWARSCVAAVRVQSRRR